MDYYSVLEIAYGLVQAPTQQRKFSFQINFNKKEALALYIGSFIRIDTDESNDHLILHLTNSFQKIGLNRCNFSACGLVTNDLIGRSGGIFQRRISTIFKSRCVTALYFIEGSENLRVKLENGRQIDD